MVFDTHNVMYYRVLGDRPALFVDTNGIGFPWSYALLEDYYYWKFVKGKVKKI